ncbi:hypothetical protein GBA65_00800 [Rubrobacter marinus]|uniref:Uncharacterized protein n=1 Tax=Rubrobacter marinus TaxID=2653852 RepID=A0A6G8PS78_9ACTN|nr:hypothetical protein [Rubrobacter marinus]QIN77290.1 hypothetical protein GBA65_00800 [Rubrobacter marinus]
MGGGLLKSTATDASGRELHDHESRIGAAGYGWTAVLVGLAFAAAGGTLLPFALAPLYEPGGPPDVTTTLVGVVFGVLFVTAGLWLAAFGLLGASRRRGVRRGREMYPGEPWRWDHGWDESGIRDDARRRPVVWALRLVALALFLVPFNAVAFSGELPWWGRLGFGLVAVTFDLVALYSLYRFARSLTQLLRYGSGGLAYGRFPFFLGEDLDVVLRPARELPGVPLKATLRCVLERYEDRGTRSEPSPTAVAYELYSDEKTAAAPSGVAGRGLGVGLSFRLPEGLPSTDLAGPPLTYWELEVRGEGPGADYEVTFLVPIYVRRLA